MRKVFNSPFKVTQAFGVNTEYYKQFGLRAHEGLDVIPTTGDWSVYSLPFKGIVVKDIDMAGKGGNYGVHVTIWYPDIKEAWMYCHLASNSLFLNQEIAPTSYIGVMGGTGNTTGPHLHLNRFKVDVNGLRLNKENGYLGGIDPLPGLEEPLPEVVYNVPTITPQTRIPYIVDDSGNPMEVQAVLSTITDLKRDNNVLRQERNDAFNRLTKTSEIAQHLSQAQDLLKSISG